MSGSDILATDCDIGSKDVACPNGRVSASRGDLGADVCVTIGVVERHGTDEKTAGQLAHDQTSGDAVFRV